MIEKPYTLAAQPNTGALHLAIFAIAPTLDGVSTRGAVATVRLTEDLQDWAAIDAIVAAHTGAPTPAHRLDAWVSQRNGRPETVNFTDPAQMSSALVPSVTIGLSGDITRIDWLAPGTETPADPYGERFGGDIVIREGRTVIDGSLGPLQRTTTLTAYRTDGTPGDTWARTRVYRGSEIPSKGKARRERVIDRLTLWLGAGAIAVGGPEGKPEQIVGAWGTANASAISMFRDNANPGPMLAMLGALDPTDPDLGVRMMLVPVAAVGIPLVAPEVDPTGTIADAITSTLFLWAP